MSIYSTGAEAYRDTAKWLVAFVPVSTIVAGAVALGPRLLEDAAAAASPTAWAQTRVAVLVGVGLIVAGVGGVLWSGARLLRTQPVDFTALLKDSEKLREAFQNGVGVPYFLDDASYLAALKKLAATWATGDAVLDAELERANASTEELRSWALQQQLRPAFRTFGWVFGLGVLLIVAGFLAVAAGLGPAPIRFGTPTVVVVELSDAGAVDLATATGCTNIAESTFLAVAGTWESPVLEVDGPDCEFGAQWRPSSGGAELRPLSEP